MLLANVSQIEDTLKENQLVILMSEEELKEMQSSIDKLPTNGKMVEWGSGGSTITWLSMMQPTQTLISIEHNKDWFQKISNFVDQHYQPNLDFHYIFAPPAYDNHQHVYAEVSEEHPFALRDYIIPPTTTAKVLDADLFFIDGIARAATAAIVMLFSENENAVYYMHDYVGREEWYDWFVDRLPFKKTIGTLLKFSRNPDLV